MIAWAVTTKIQTRTTVVLLMAEDREEAKRVAHQDLRGNPDHYIVEPLSRYEDRVVLRFVIQGGGQDASQQSAG